MYAYLIVHSYPFDQRKTKINDLYNGEYYNEQEKEKLFIELVAFSGGETVFTSLLAIVAEIFGNDQNKLFRLLDIYFNRADAKLLEELFKFLDKIKDHDFYNEAVKQKITLFANSTLEKADISDL